MHEISHLNRQKPITAPIDLGDGDVIEVVFDRNKMTSEWDERVRSESGFKNGLAEVLLSWDVVENGQPLPPTAENIGRLSIPAQGALYQEIIQAAVPSRAEGNASATTSSTPSTDSSSRPENLQNGPAPLPSPTPSASPSPT